MHLLPNFEYRAVGVSIFCSSSVSKNEARITFQITPNGSVPQLASGESIFNLDAHLFVYPESNKPGFDEHIGTLSYDAGLKDVDISFDSRILAVVAVPDCQYENLVSAAMHGHVPSYIGITVDSINDEWDVTAITELKICSIQISVPLVTYFNESEDEARDKNI